MNWKTSQRKLSESKKYKEQKIAREIWVICKDHTILLRPQEEKRRDNRANKYFRDEG